MEAPAISNYTKTYDGSAAPLPMPNLPGGNQSMTIADNATAKAANIKWLVFFVMQLGYPQLSSAIVSYSIEKAAQTCGVPTLAASDANSLTLNAVETACYKELEGPSTMQATEKTLVTFERFPDQSVEYTGHAQTCTLPKHNVGITSMTITGYDGVANPPTNVGSYAVNIDSNSPRRFPRRS